jgi:hypothetical protein
MRLQSRVLLPILWRRRVLLPKRPWGGRATPLTTAATLRLNVRAACAAFRRVRIAQATKVPAVRGATARLARASATCRPPLPRVSSTFPGSKGLRQPRQKVSRLRASVAEDLCKDSGAEIFTSMVGNSCSSAVLVPEEFVTASLPHLDEAEGFEKANDLTRPHRMQAAQALTSTCSSATNFILGASCSARQRAITSRILGASSSSVRAWV